MAPPQDKRGLDTILAHAGCQVDESTGAITPPIHFSSTFERNRDLSYPKGYIYARIDNPTRRQLEEVLTEVEGGASTAVFNSGQTAAAPGGHLIIPDDMYHGISTLIRTTYTAWNLSWAEVDMSDLVQVETALQTAQELRDSGKVTGPLIVWTETPSNPLTKITDIKAVATMVHAVGGLVLVDSTWVTPWITQPLALGADMVMHSLTKYIAGHSDLTGGCIVGGTSISGTDGFFSKIRHFQCFVGAGLPPFDSWLTMRGMRSMAARMRVHCDNAMAVAQHLDAHPRIHKVHYPGLCSHPGHAVAKQQMHQRYGGMLSVEVNGGLREAVNFAGHLQLFKRATSLGGTESLVEHRRSIEPPDSKTPPTLLRFSVGLEDVNDLLADIDHALASIEVDCSAASKL